MSTRDDKFQEIMPHHSLLSEVVNFVVKYCSHCIILYCVFILGQYLHILQDSKRYLTNPTVQVQTQLTSN